MRHPANDETNVAAGTPSTEATDTPDRMIDVARPTDRSGTSRVPSPAAKAQNPPMLTPVSTLAASMTRWFWASAPARSATASTAISPSRIVLRSIARAASASTGAATAATRPVSDIVSPAVPVDTPRSEAIEVSRPTGSISLLTMVKVPIATEVTASQRARTAPETSVVVMPPSLRPDRRREQ